MSLLADSNRFASDEYSWRLVGRKKIANLRLDSFRRARVCQGRVRTGGMRLKNVGQSVYNLEIRWGRSRIWNFAAHHLLGMFFARLIPSRPLELRWSYVLDI
jgi:hypothetical protein